MKPRISFITLAVADLDRSLRFYRDGLGLPTEGIIGTEFGPEAQVVFIKMNAGLTLALWPRTSLIKQMHVPGGPPNPSEFALAHNVGSREEVDALFAQVRQAGATITREPHEPPWGGYAGYFQDPDGHVWEIAFMPGFKPED